MNTHKLRDKVFHAIAKLKEAKYKLPIDSIELAGGSPTCIVKIMKNIVRMFPSSVMETCYGDRLKTMNDYVFIESTYKLLANYGQEPNLTYGQFFAPGFGARKIDFLLQYLAFCSDMHRLKVDVGSSPKLQSPGRRPNLRVTPAKEGVVVDYGTYAVQRHRPVNVEPDTVAAEETEKAKKEGLRKSVEDYEKCARSSGKEFGYSPMIRGGEKARPGEDRDQQIATIKDEVTKLSHEFAGYKNIVQESIGEVRRLVEQLQKQLQTSDKGPINMPSKSTEDVILQPVKEEEDKVLKSDDSFVKIKPNNEEGEGQNAVLAPDELVITGYTGFEPRKDYAVPTTEPISEHNVEAIMAPVAGQTAEPARYEADPGREIEMEREDIGSDLKEEEVVKEEATAEVGIRQPGIDPSLMKTDEFIIDKFKKMTQVKDLLKSLNS